MHSNVNNSNREHHQKQREIYWNRILFCFVVSSSVEPVSGDAKTAWKYVLFFLFHLLKGVPFTHTDSLTWSWASILLSLVLNMNKQVKYRLAYALWSVSHIPCKGWGNKQENKHLVLERLRNAGHVNNTYHLFTCCKNEGGGIWSPYRRWCFASDWHCTCMTRYSVK